jgi:hypothetical protein
MTTPGQQSYGPRFHREQILLRMSSVLKPHPECLAEFERLIDRTKDDPRMAVGRARGLLEWLIAERHPASAGRRLVDRLRTLSKRCGISPVFFSLAHRVRTDGNDAFHYFAKRGGWVRFSETDAVFAAARIAELVEREFTTDWCIYSQALPDPHRSLYNRFLSSWRPVLKEEHGKRFHLFGILDLVLRGVLARMEASMFEVLRKYAMDGTLQSHLPDTEQAALREMRNMGLIGHNKKWLFVPERSTTVWMEGRAQVLLALMRKESPASKEIETVACEVEEELAHFADDAKLMGALKKAREQRTVTHDNYPALQELRDLNLLTHDAPLLAGSKEVRLTELGDYIVGPATPDPQ